MKKKQFADDFFVPIQGELYNCLEDGKMTPVEWCVYCVLLRQVDFETGIWRGAAYRIQHDWNFQIPQRTVQSAMKKLCDSGRLKSFHVKGDKKDYPIAIDGYRIRFGKMKGCTLDAHATTDPKHPVYVRPENPENEQPSPPDDRSDTAATPQNERRVTAATPYANARNTPDSPDIPNNPEERDIDTYHSPRGAAPLSQIEKGAAAAAAAVKEKESQQLAENYLIWLVRNYDLILSAKETTTIKQAILSGSCDGKVLKEVSARILQGLDTRNSFDRAGEKLALNLPIVIEANRREAEQRRKNAEEIERIKEDLQRKAQLDNQCRLAEVDLEAEFREELFGESQVTVGTV